jgi:dihydropteroate synthase
VITDSKDTLFLKKHCINLAGRLMTLDVPRIMGILNVTPDSFYDGGLYTDPKDIRKRAIKLVEEGADIIDLGACSSRPGAEIPDENEELGRLRPAAEAIRQVYPDFPLSIDTFRVNIARTMIDDYSASMVNDITAGENDPEMIDLIAEKRVPYVLMHMKGIPSTMQNNPDYLDVLSEVLLFFVKKISVLKSRGVIDYIVDPGFGFGKTTDHNYRLLNGLDQFPILEAPVMVGVSRKSMIYKQLETDSSHSLNGTTALHMYALMKGANILRVHDVKEAYETVRLYLKLQSSSD